ncbi:MAG TPA: magnesium transporter [Clostridia bacterium]|nr:magnesium transporter [Clostridia bacterium]
MIREREQLMQQLMELLRIEKKSDIAVLISQYQPADIAEILTELETHYRGTVFQLLSRETAAMVLEELEVLDESVIFNLVESLGAKYLADIINEMASDDAADLLGRLPQETREIILELMQHEEAVDVQELLEYDVQSAGGIMTTEYVAIRKDITAGRAIDVLREIAPEAETVYYVYVVDIKNRLVGVITLRELIVADPHALIENIMHRKVISVTVDMDQEEVARVVSKYNFLAVPVVDKDNSLLGIITVDDVIDVIYEEASEDIYLLGGSTELSDQDQSIMAKALKSRLPWLFITMLEGLIAGTVLRGLERELSAVVALAFFIPLLTGMGGNVGTQSATIAVRGLAVGQIDTGDVFRVAARETLTGITLGLINGLIVAVIAALWQNSFVLGVIVGLAMLGNMTTAALMGTLVPIAFKKWGIDPAVASAPFITASIDITGLLIYSTLASFLIGFLL